MVLLEGENPEAVEKRRRKKKKKDAKEKSSVAEEGGERDCGQRGQDREQRNVWDKQGMNGAEATELQMVLLEGENPEAVEKRRRKKKKKDAKEKSSVAEEGGERDCGQTGQDREQRNVWGKQGMNGAEATELQMVLLEGENPEAVEKRRRRKKKKKDAKEKSSVAEEGGERDCGQTGQGREQGNVWGKQGMNGAEVTELQAMELGGDTETWQKKKKKKKKEKKPSVGREVKEGETSVQPEEEETRKTEKKRKEKLNLVEEPPAAQESETPRRKKKKRKRESSEQGATAGEEQNWGITPGEEAAQMGKKKKKVREAEAREQEEEREKRAHAASSGARKRKKGEEGPQESREEKRKKKREKEVEQERENKERRRGDSGPSSPKTKRKAGQELAAVKKTKRKKKLKTEEELSGGESSEVEFVSAKPGNVDEVTIDKERRQALQNAIDEESRPQATEKTKSKGVGFGQWSTTCFESEDQQKKFLRLMGGFKKSSPSLAPVGGAGPHRPIMALGRDEARQLNQRLLGQFERAHSRWLNPQQTGAGLGFQGAPSKKFTIDAHASRSVKFED
ncbi:lysine-rich nucleolar protein 1 [Lepisosteus oculatus]|uniref:lysine-rich nucleolar protein 1 n=1 Tax=Lepisosteus oculatus TaxID=7918 RepID=UPI0035F52739